MGDKIYTFGILLAVLFLARQVVSYISEARFKRKHGCKHEARIPQFERIIGYDIYRIQVKAAKEKKNLEVAKGRYDKYGLTWSVSVMGRRFINTIETENIKTVLATNFKEYGLGGWRQASFYPLLGDGIFTTGTEFSTFNETFKLTSM
jgi:hypothetical protein